MPNYLCHSKKIVCPPQDKQAHHRDKICWPNNRSCITPVFHLKTVFPLQSAFGGFLAGTVTFYPHCFETQSKTKD